MDRLLFFLILLMQAPLAGASGPVAPTGWEGSYAARLPNGQPCCLPADLNGTGLVGGAFVLVSSNKKEFGLFALAYTPPLKERWQLLEKHPISLLPAFRVSIEPAGQFAHGGIRACTTATRCTRYFAPSADAPFRRASPARARE